MRYAALVTTFTDVALHVSCNETDAVNSDGNTVSLKGAGSYGFVPFRETFFFSLSFRGWSSQSWGCCFIVEKARERERERELVKLT